MAEGRLRRPGSPPSGSRSLLALAGSGAAAFGVAGIGGVVTARSVDTWYRRLDKPPWTPPDRVFGPVWSLLYGAQAVAAWLLVVPYLAWVSFALALTVAVWRRNR